MKIWSFCVQLFGYEVTRYRYIDVPVTDEQYDVIHEFIRQTRPLVELPFYADLARKAEELVYSSLVDDMVDEPEEPELDDFDTEEEYDEAMEDYETAMDEYENMCEQRDSFSVNRTFMDDPGDLVRLNRDFVGTKIKNYTDLHESNISFEWSNNDGIEMTIEISVDKDGCITNITIVKCEGCEWADQKSSSYADCYPPYDFVREKLKAELL